MVVNCVDWWSGDIANFLYGVQSSNMMAAATIVANTFGVQYSFGASLQTGVSTVVGNALGRGQPVGHSTDRREQIEPTRAGRGEDEPHGARHAYLKR